VLGKTVTSLPIALPRQRQKLKLDFSELLTASSISSIKRHVGAACLALATAIYLTEPSINSALLPLAFALFGVSVFLIGTTKLNRVYVALIGIIVTSAWLAVPFSMLFSRPLAPTILLAVFTSIMVPLLFLKERQIILYWLIPVWIIQYGLMAYQWISEPNRANGLAQNANAGSSFLLLGAIFLIHQPRLRMLAVPLLVAIPFSGSRWVLLVGIGVFGLMFLFKCVNWKWSALVITSALALLITFQHTELLAAYRQGMNNSIQDIDTHADVSQGDYDGWKILIPKGFHDTTLHSLPLRMADETGLLSALAWLGVGAFSFYQKPRRGSHWWMLAAVYLLSAMYYFTWYLLPFWWLLVAKEKAPPATRPSLSEPRALP